MGAAIAAALFLAAAWNDIRPVKAQLTEARSALERISTTRTTSVRPRREPRPSAASTRSGPASTAPGAVSAMYRQATRQPIDGVIGVDVPALAAMLRSVGPIDVQGISEPITAENVARILLHDLYEGVPSRSTTRAPGGSGCPTSPGR